MTIFCEKCKILIFLRFFFFSVGGRYAKLLFVGTEERGVILKTAKAINFRGSDALRQHFFCQKKALDGNVFPHGGTRGAFENSVQMGFADIESLCEGG